MTAAPPRLRRRRQLTLRGRLALLFAGSLAVFGTALLASTQVLVQRSLTTEPRRFQDLVEERLGLPAGTLDGLRFPPAGEVTFRAVQEELTGAVLRELLLQSVVTLVVAIVVAGVVGWFTAGRFVRPLREITDTTRGLSAATLDRRIALDGARDELHELASTVDAMLDRLQGAFASQRRFVADASHELRTPLAVMRTELDVTLADPDVGVDDFRVMGATLQLTVDRVERLLDALFALALADSAVGVRRDEQADLALDAAGAVDRLRDAAAERDLTVRTDLGPASVVGDASLLDRLVANLVDNAVRHAAAGGHVRVVTRSTGGEAQVVVTNPVPEGSVPDTDALFRPFHRGEARTGRGSGLGLTIARSIATAHGGSLDAEATGTGFTVTARLPVAPAGPGAAPD
ncbi:MAG: sensor histidine kinase [Kineosporiaceae bacterium]